MSLSPRLQLRASEFEMLSLLHTSDIFLQLASIWRNIDRNQSTNQASTYEGNYLHSLRSGFIVNFLLINNSGRVFPLNLTEQAVRGL